VTMIIEFTLGTLVNLCLLITRKAVEEKKVYMLLKSVIFHYHGLDDEEKKDLDKTANDLAAHEEYKWALDFVAQDYITAFDRARNYLNDIIGDYQKEKRVELINMVWQANNVKKTGMSKKSWLNWY